MVVYSFKHVGKTQDKTLEETRSSTAIPIGIKTPLQLGDNGLFAMHFSLADQLHDNLRSLLLTNHGERLGIHNFGANLRPLTTELVSEEDFITQAIERIKTAVDRWMPYIDLENFMAENEKTKQGIAAKKITVIYNISALGVVNKSLQIVLYAI